MSAKFVKIINGSYRNQDIVDMTFPLVKPFKQFAKKHDGSGFVTVMGSSSHNIPNMQDKQCRITLDDISHMQYLDSKLEPTTYEDPTMQPIEAVPDFVQEYKDTETDEEAMERIGRSFEILDELTVASGKGIVRGMVVSGAPGIGKSFGVEHTLERMNSPAKIAGKDPKFEVIRGTASALGLYKTLYLNRHKGFVTVLDDCDSILYDETSLNLLKAALDSGNKRSLHWLTDSRSLKEDDIPSSFEYDGSVIFLTNLDFRRTNASKIKDHLNAIMSRCHYLDLELSTTRDQILRIKQIVSAGMLKSYRFDEAAQQEVVDFIETNKDDMMELSLRMVKKIADLREAMPTKWMEFAEATCIKPETKYRRRLAAKETQDD